MPNPLTAVLDTMWQLLFWLRSARTLLADFDRRTISTLPSCPPQSCFSQHVGSLRLGDIPITLGVSYHYRSGGRLVYNHGLTPLQALSVSILRSANPPLTSR